MRRATILFRFKWTGTANTLQGMVISMQQLGAIDRDAIELAVGVCPVDSFEENKSE